MSHRQLISTQTVLQHSSPDDCWIVIEGEVWDVTRFVPEHPGGPSVILKYAGRDATKEYAEIHSSSVVREGLTPDCFKGRLDPATIMETWASVDAKKPATIPAPSPQDAEAKPPLDSIINLYDFDQAAAASASKKAYTFYSTAATDCWTRDSNHAMLKRIWFRPRVMKNVASVDISSRVLGIPVKMPLFICPTGLAKLIHPDGEKALARAAKSSGILEIISSASSHPIEQVVQEAPGHPFLFQLYLNKEKEKSRLALEKAESLGIRAVFLTVDAAGRGKRESDERLKVDEVIVNPVTGQRIVADKKGGGLTRMMGSYIDQGMTWKDIAWIRSVTKMPIVLKGITSAEDARIAMEHNVDGIMLSNHGGRNLDFSPPSILLLLEMHKNCPEVFDSLEVYVDGGFRRGGDIIKALCLGARAVGIGRTFLYSLHYGTEGAEHLVQLLKDEMESVMKLIGISDLSQVHPGLVNTADVDHLVPSGKGHPYATWRPSSRL